MRWRSSDVDGDGDLDAVLGNAADRFTGLGVAQNALWINDGSGNFTAVPLPADTDATYGVALADADGDGDLDLWTANEGILDGRTGQNRVFLNDGAGAFAAAPVPRDDDDAYGVAVADLDGDGDNDAVFGGWREQMTLWLNDGAGALSDATPPRVTRATSSNLGDHTLVDVDGDGDDDLVVAVYGASPPVERPQVFANDGYGRSPRSPACRPSPWTRLPWSLPTWTGTETRM